jgi:hypothetical protein
MVDINTSICFHLQQANRYFQSKIKVYQDNRAKRRAAWSQLRTRGFESQSDDESELMEVRSEQPPLPNNYFEVPESVQG